MMPRSLCNPEAEKALLGALLLKNDLLYTLAGLKAEAFGLPSNGLIFEAIKAEAVTGADLVTVTDHLNRAGKLEAVGGAEYVSSLTDGMFALSTVDHYREIIESAALRRRMQAASRDLWNLAGDGASDGEVLGRAEALILGLRDHHHSKLYTGKDLVDLELQDARRRAGEEERGDGLRFGLPRLDRATAPGIQRKDFWIVGARPSVGKTSFLCGIADYNVQQGRRVLHIACEMGVNRTAWRLFSQHSGVSLRSIRAAKLAHEEEGRYNKALRFYDGADNFILAYFPRPKPVEIQGTIRRARSILKGLDLVVLDYFQKVAPEAKRGRLFEEKQETVARLVEIGAEENIPLVVGCQLNREAESDRQQDRPTKAELRDTGRLEEEATGILLLHRWGMKAVDESQAGAEIILEKQQDGPTGNIPARFARDLARWEALEPIEVQAAGWWQK